MIIRWKIFEKLKPNISMFTGVSKALFGLMKLDVTKYYEID